ncbi:MAG TPA: SIS domain-containing protein [Blastocatellia bacterium]|nr:SIS domain-containing protein [Blastocatellia bacterium]
MPISRDQAPPKDVPVDASAWEKLADSVMRLTDEEPANAAAVDGESKRPTDSIETFFDLVIDELAALRTRAKVDAVERAADLILDCESQGGRVHVTGIGKSEHIARYVASLLSSTGTPAYFLHATECTHGSAGQVCASDVAIAISNSGATPELLSAIETLRDLGIKIIGVSGNKVSELARISDVLLDAGVENEGGELNLVPRASILAKLYVLCSLSVALEAHKGLTREQYARWHPGGALGRLASGHSGAEATTRHDTPSAVLNSSDELESMVKGRSPTLDSLGAEFDSLLSRMQTSKVRKGMRDAFNASSPQLGRAAVKTARKRR